MKSWQKICPLIFVFLILGLLASLFIVVNRASESKKRPIDRYAVPAKLPKKIGIIRHLKVLDPVVDGFRSGMREAGLINGKNIVYDVQLAQEGDNAKLRDIAQNFVQQEVDLIFAVDGIAARAALDETAKTGKTYIPIIFAYAHNPVETTLVLTYRSSFNNATGVAVDLKGITEKKLELLKQVNPNIKKIGIFVSKFASPQEKLLLTQVRIQASQFDIEVVEYPVARPPGPASTAELRGLSQRILPGEIDAYYHIPDSLLSRIENLKLTGEMGARLRIPTLYPSENDLRVSGGLFSYGHDLVSVGRQAAEIAATILKENRRPEDIPIQSPQKNFLVINLATAGKSQIPIPQELIDIADKLIE